MSYKFKEKMPKWAHFSPLFARHEELVGELCSQSQGLEREAGGQ
jgi:hypothetical protein